MKQDYVKTNWLDHIVENPFAFLETANPDGTISLEPKPGEILQQGTPVNARNLNHMEDGIFLMYQMLADLYDKILSLQIDVATLKNTSINDMTNNIFFISFSTLNDIELKSGIHDAVNKKIYI